MGYIASQSACPRCGSKTAAQVLDSIQAPASPVTNLLGTNAVPNMSEYPSIQLIISEGQSYLKSLDAEIARTRPLSVVMAERVSGLRAWAADRTVKAD